MEADLLPETVAFLLLEFEDMLNHCNLEENVFDNIADVIYLLANVERGTTIHLNLLK